jgi:hypothetical protein
MELPMKRVLGSVLTLVTVTCAAAAQEVPAVVFKGDCDNGLPRYPQWFQSTKLAYGKPYSIATDRHDQIVRNYPKLHSGMSLREVEELLGKPDFSVPFPPARLANAPQPIGQRCRDEIAYILKKAGVNMSDTQDVAIYLFFSLDGALYWAAPQNLSTLKEWGSPTDSSVMQSSKPADISAVAASGVVNGNHYTNSFFRMSLDSSDTTVELNPLVNSSGQRVTGTPILNTR